MRELQLRLEEPEIQINGRAFALQLSDLELFTRVTQLFERMKALEAGEHTPAEILALAREASALLDAALGENAAPKISGGRPVSLPLLTEWLATLAQNAAEQCVAEALSDPETEDE